MTVETRERTTQLAWLVFGTVSLCWAVASAFMAPVHGQSDTIIHKGGGTNWALGFGFVNATADNPSMEFKPYGSYPPLYSFVFGLWSKIFGVGEYQNTYFELLIGIIRNALFLWIALRFLSSFLTGKSAVIFSLLTAIVVPYHHYQDRPESFCVILFECGLLAYALLNKLQWRYFGLGLFFGLLCITSPFCALASFLAFGAIALGELRTSSWQERTQFLRWAVVGGIIAVVPALIYYIVNPEAFALLVKHGTAVGGLRQSFFRLVSEGNWKGVVEKTYGMFGGGYAHLHYQAGAAFALIISAIIVGRLKNSLSPYLQIALIATFLLALSISSSPHYFAYSLWLSVLLTFYAISKSSASVGYGGRLLTWLLIFSVTILFMPTVVRHGYARWHYREEYQKKTEALREIFHRNNDIKYVVTSPYYYHLLRPYRPTFDYSRMRQEDLTRILSSQEKVVLYEDTTAASLRLSASKSFLTRFLWKPGDERFTKVYRVGEYLFVEAEGDETFTKLN